MRKKHQSPETLCKQLASDLLLLADLLIRHGVVGDTSPLMSAASSLKPFRPTTQDSSRDPKKSKLSNTFYWRYDIDDLIFDLSADKELQRHLRPQTAVNLKLVLTVKIKALFTSDNDSADLLEDLNIGCVVEAEDSEDHQKKPRCCWHLDRHILENSQPGGTTLGEPKVAHPLYHFQYGGRHIWDLADFGHHLILDPPRIAHPPLDGVLAVDFVLSNYLGSKWLELREDTVYQRIVKSSQQLFWKPYAQRIAAFDANTQSFWPQLLLD